MNTCSGFRNPFSHLQSSLGGGFALTDRRSRHGRFPFWRCFGGIVWLNELKGLCRGSRRSSSQGLRFAGFGVMLVFARNLPSFSTLVRLVRAPAPLFFHACLTVLDVPKYRLSQDARSPAPRCRPADLAGPTRVCQEIRGIESLAPTPAAVPLFWLVRTDLYTMRARVSNRPCSQPHKVKYTRI